MPICATYTSTDAGSQRDPSAAAGLAEGDESASAAAAERPSRRRLVALFIITLIILVVWSKLTPSKRGVGAVGPEPDPIVGALGAGAMGAAFSTISKNLVEVRAPPACALCPCSTSGAAFCEVGS